LMPELSRLLGEPPPLAEVGVIEAKIRSQLTVQRFVRATATRKHPLLLFLDDLQWADAASMALLQGIATDADASHLLLVIAFRDNELADAHALHALVKAAAEISRCAPTCHLAPLGVEAVLSMLTEMLSRPPEELVGLPGLVKAKTDGSPFFVEQFLRAL